MEFSHSGKYLLSVSRDRTWCLFERVKEEDKSNYFIFIFCLTYCRIMLGRSTCPHNLLAIWHWKELSEKFCLIKKHRGKLEKRLCRCVISLNWASFSYYFTGLFKIKAKYEKKSKVISRVIWSCSWTVDDRYFLTASRDKKVTIYWHEKSVKPYSGDKIRSGCTVDTLHNTFLLCDEKCNSFLFLFRRSLFGGKMKRRSGLKWGPYWTLAKL